jgi:hypothetical protein
MKSWSVDDIMNLRPCVDYTKEVVGKLFAGRERLTASEIAAVNIPAKDRVWVLIKLLDDDRARRLFACDCAERVLARVPSPDGRGISAVATAREFANGRASVEIMLHSARCAAYAAAAAAAAERQWQVERLVAYHDGSAENIDAKGSPQ